ncbi:hypothetical protein LEP1GSC079_1855 [Leptospira interrogans str. FPW1039]|nr:hypothetical protein LEP1GSC079_1855 [Leptospira interrogans str. FPW1039]EMN53885.1 hypothetical protein LEP1GSC089_1319 [Leptospira interrogans serovar Autumnalis str. LP101]EMN97038.1 hypothetical protein LEP1GSC110_4647 [Leptospira interrogans serovar Medanensis str. UT053]
MLCIDRIFSALRKIKTDLKIVKNIFWQIQVKLEKADYLLYNKNIHFI